MSKISVIFINRLRNFYRTGYQWVMIFSPLLFVVLELFLIYAVLESTMDDDDDDKEKEDDKEELISILFTCYFILFYILGQCVSAQVFAFNPLNDKKMGLRQMMFMSGLNSFEYWTGLWMADMLILAIPNLVFTAIMPIFEMIMKPSNIGYFVLVWFLFQANYITVIYLFSHVFAGPESGGKALTGILSGGLLMLPLLLSSLLGGFIADDFGKFFANAASPFYFFDPFITGPAQLYLTCIEDSKYMSDWGFKLFNSLDPTYGVYVGVMIAQFIVFFSLNLVIDTAVMNGYKKRSSHQGAEPPLLDVRQDVIDHENDVKSNS